MERNIGDQLNKAFEAYRQVSIEKDNAKKQLQQMVNKNQIKKVTRGKRDKRQFRACAQLIALFCSLFFWHRLNITSDTLRSSRSRSRTSSSSFHNSGRSCWRRGSRQVGERPSCQTATSLLCLCPLPTPNQLNCCRLSLFWLPRRHEVRVPQPSIQRGQCVQENAVPGTWFETAISGSKQFSLLKPVNSSERGYGFLLFSPRCNLVVVV